MSVSFFSSFTGILRRVGSFFGLGVSAQFFKDNIITTVIVLMACVMIIAMRFDCLTARNKIDRLNDQINVVRTEKQRYHSHYSTITRESAMIHLVDSLRLGLVLPDEHARELHISVSEQ